MGEQQQPRILDALFKLWGIPERDHSHFETENWVDESPKNGWIRTHCRKCGSLIGYRPVQKKRKGMKPTKTARTRSK